jgi:hypothetical protein
MPPENEGNQLSRTSSPSPILRPGNTLDTALEKLSKDHQNQLTVKAAEAQVRIDTSEKEADLRDRASTRDMAKTIDAARILDTQTKTDHTIKSTFETASGHTSFEIKKNNNTVIIVVAVVIGTVVLMLFSRR